MNTKSILEILICFLLFNFGFSQEIIMKGNYKVLYPTDSEKLEIDIIDKSNSKLLEIKETGKYILISNKHENYKIYFETNREKKIVGNIIISNYRPGDSTIVNQENLRFVSAKSFINNKLHSEVVYEKDSIFSYKNYFINAHYEGKTKLKKYGYFNIEHKEFDSIQRLKIYNYAKDGIYFEQNYKEGKLYKKKYIENNESRIIFYENEKVKKKCVYRFIDDNYYVFTYNEKNTLIKKEIIDRLQFEKEFPLPESTIK